MTLTPWGPRAPARPRLALSLRRLGREVDEQWPVRDRSSDGWLGDAAHQSRLSDHNPDRNGVVHAIDVDASGIDGVALLHAVIAHPSTHYAIFRRQIYSRRVGFAARPYDGPDPHTSHLHVSISLSRSAEISRRSWLGSVK